MWGFFPARVASGSALAVMDGAGHLDLCDPIDPTTARGFLEDDPGPAAPARRALLGELIASFCSHHLGLGTDAAPLDSFGEEPMLREFRLR